MATKTNEGRILDKDFEDEINSNIGEAQKYVQKNMGEAHKYMRKKQSLIEDAVSERPFEFVIGAFLGGLLIGALISRK